MDLLALNMSYNWLHISSGAAALLVGAPTDKAEGAQR